MTCCDIIKTNFLVVGFRPLFCSSRIIIGHENWQEARKFKIRLIQFKLFFRKQEKKTPVSQTIKILKFNL